ncbi:MAG: NTP transferase domain-containing protein [Gammaproteobacteria bacterium]|jgi:CTP:molybdopterin cytidylyltransferase MocA|nr:NTP transferase domain-containing protein [Gammaproteobacteria bacterium]
MNRQANLAAILLAAGPSSRLGQPKQLVSIDGESLVRRTARLLLDLDLYSVTVVTGCESEKVGDELSDLQAEVVHNRLWEQGMGGSIAFGVRQLSRMVDGVLIMVCDQWRVEKNDLVQLIEQWNSDISRIVVSNWNEGKAFVSGPPVIFTGNLIPEMKYLISSEGARQVIDRHMDIVEFVLMENAAYDLDRPEDLKLITNRS